MNKYIIIVVILGLIIGGGAFYRAKFVPDIEKNVATGVDRPITITVFENTWTFQPEEIEIDKGDKIILTIINNDEYDHGFAVDAYGISQRLPAKETIKIEFVASKSGDFPYYCSVSCGSGIVDGEKRGHFDHVGKLRVLNITSETIDYEPESDADFARQARESAIVSTANEKATETGFDINTLSVLFDLDNALWGIYQKSENLEIELPQKGYQSVLYRDDSNKPVLWVFVDTLSGDVIETFEVE